MPNHIHYLKRSFQGGNMIKVILIGLLSLSSQIGFSQKTSFPFFDIQAQPMKVTHTEYGELTFKKSNQDCGKTDYHELLKDHLSDKEKSSKKISMMRFVELEKELDGLLRVGKKVFDLFKTGEARFKMNDAPSISVLPFKNPCWAKLTGWKVPVRKVITKEYTNKYTGQRMLKVDLVLRYTYGGQSEDGSGSYLTNIQVVPQNINIPWTLFGIDVNVSVATGNPINLGTKKSPIAGLQLDINWNVHTPLKKIIENSSVFITGEGDFHEI